MNCVAFPSRIFPPGMSQQIDVQHRRIRVVVT